MKFFLIILFLSCMTWERIAAVPFQLEIVAAGWASIKKIKSKKKKQAPEFYNL